MEEQGYIELRITNKDNTLGPEDVDISEVKDIISDVESFLFPSRKDKLHRPLIAYDVNAGSVRHKFVMPISSVILFEGLTAQISSRNSLDFLDRKRQSIMSKFQETAIRKGYRIEFNHSLSEKPSLIIDYSSTFKSVAPTYFKGEFYLYGEIYQEGGKRPNVHITTKRHGNLTVDATKEQIMDGKKKTYKPYGIKVRGKKNLEDNKLEDLELIEFIEYKAVFDQSLLDKVIDKAAVNLSKIKNVDSWINDLKADDL